MHQYLEVAAKVCDIPCHWAVIKINSHSTQMDHKEREKKKEDEIRKIICRGIGVVGPEKRGGCIEKEKKKGSKMMRKNHTGG